MAEWISVKERLPYNKAPFCETVLVYTILGTVMPGFCNNGDWYVMRPENDYCDAIDGDIVTHWMPMPKPPKEDEV